MIYQGSTAHYSALCLPFSDPEESEWKRIARTSLLADDLRLAHPTSCTPHSRSKALFTSASLSDRARCGCLEAVDKAEMQAKEVKISSPRAEDRLWSVSNEWALSGGDDIPVEVTRSPMDVQARATLAQLGTVKHQGTLGNNLGMPSFTA